MYVNRHFPLGRALLWSYPSMLVGAAWATALTLGHHTLGFEWMELPTLPVTILGTAVSFYLGFKGNAAYQRLWEARKIWGGIVNDSRSWGTFVTSMVTDFDRKEHASRPLKEIHRELVYRHVAWLAALRTQLLRAKTWEHRKAWNDQFRKKVGTLDQSPAIMRERLHPFLDAGELDHLMEQKNQATQLLQVQGQRLRDLMNDGRIDDFRHMELAKLLATFYTLQGKCERIKNFPLPRQYATANHWFVKTFTGLLPFALIGVFDQPEMPELYVWLTVPASAVMTWVFLFWDMVVDYTENPFEGLINDIPMHALSRTIEIDLREMLGETDLPPGIAVHESGGLF